MPGDGSGWVEKHSTFTHDYEWQESDYSAAFDKAGYKVVTVGITPSEHTENITLAPLVAVTKEEIADAVWDELRSEHTSEGSFGDAIGIVIKVEKGRWKIENKKMIFYDEDGATILFTFNLFDKDGNPAEINIFERRPA